MTTGKRIGRMVVWPTYHDARSSDTEESKYAGRLTVWHTYAEAEDNLELSDDSVRAVHFDGSSWLHTASLTALDNAFISYSFWFKFPNDQIGNALWVSDPENNYDFNATISNDHTLRLGLLAIAGGAAIYGGTTFAEINDGMWHHCLISADTGQDGSGKIVAVYIDDVADTFLVEDASGNAFNQAYNALSFWIFSDGFQDPGEAIIGDFADVWIAPGVSLLTDGVIPEETRRLFISAEGKPTDPSGFPSSAILLSGDHTTFALNQGTGGELILTGSLTDASSSPSD